VRLFWVALTVLDPLVVVLIWLRRRAGVVLGAAVMLCDVGVNLTVAALYGGLAPFGLISQVLFGALVLATAPWLWRRLRR
jgi:hypothetical protein